jgi:glycine dehydrogenase subunit 2
MRESIGTTGLIMNEPFLWEKGRKGRKGFSFPRRDVEPSPLDRELIGEGPDFPDLSEIDVVRHYTRLSQWNFGVDTGMYPLGSCTMKYSPKSNESHANFSGFKEAHPLLPAGLCQGTLQMMYELETSLQPAAGAHGELTGMLLIHRYHESKGIKRSSIMIPDTAHGTNPASAALCGYRPIPVKSSDQGILSVDAVHDIMDEETAGIMITNPNTLGLFEENLKQISEIVHSKGGLVYGDGANMNAIMGMVKMGDTGVDIMHLNLHKTFSTPHGGGGPGSGPVCVKKHLEPFLPVPRVIEDSGKYVLAEDYPESIGKVQAFHGNVGVMIKAYSYIRSMGPENLKKASQLAVLNANYIKERLKGSLHLAYDRPCMHECVFSDKLQKDYHVTTLDMAKRLMDYGFHPPTVYFPLVVDGAIMMEPTETESKEDIDQYIEAFKAIVDEAKDDPDLLHGAPHKCKVKRLDETTAARKPCLAG